MRSAIVALAFIGSVMGLDASEHDTVRFVNWISQHGKSYETVDEFNKRQAIWMTKDKFIKEFYEKEEGMTFEVAHNKFSDWSEEEFKGMLGTGLKEGNSTVVPKNATRLLPMQIPSSWDWRNHHKVTPVKNQGHCGGCWSFATAATLESSHAVATGQLFSLSEQQFISCVNETYGCLGCNGGEVWGAYQYWMDSGNYLSLESAWRFAGETGECEYTSKAQTSLQVNDYYTVPQNDSSQLYQFLAKQPVALYIDAGTLVFQSYKNGIINSDKCLTEINHGVTAVGYGVSPDGTKYWIIKNSWGTEWGENGYVRIADSDDSNGGICGVNTSPYTAVTVSGQ